MDASVLCCMFMVCTLSMDSYVGSHQLITSPSALNGYSYLYLYPIISTIFATPFLYQLVV